MAIRLFHFLCLLFFLFYASANPNPAGAGSTVFVPDFSEQALTVPKGTIVSPLCANPADPSCLSQWSHQAVPLFVRQNLGAALGQYQYFLPVFMPSQLTLEDPRESEDWMPYTPSFQEYAKDRRRGFTQPKRGAGKEKSKSFKPQARVKKKKDTEETEKAKSEKNTEEIEKAKKKQENEKIEGAEKKQGAEETDKTQKPDQEAETAPSQAPEPPEAEREKPPERRDDQTGRDAAPEETEKTTPVEQITQTSTPKGTEFYVNRIDQSRVARVETDEKGNKTITTGNVLFVPDDSIQPDHPSPQPESPTPKNAPITSEAPTTMPSPEKPKDDVDTQFPSSTASAYRLTQDTTALRASTKEIQPGCVVIKKQETEAGFCSECVEDSVLPDNMVKNTKIAQETHEKLIEVDKESLKKIDGQIAGAPNDRAICSPQSSLKYIIKNFEKTCSPKNFKNFAGKASCASCNRGVPLEVMLAMMSIESAGKCTAVGELSNEESIGLFQIDSKQHQCRGNTKGSMRNKQCLMKLEHNLDKSIDLLIKSYTQVNPAARQPQCKDWNQMSPAERDSWRRAVSGYNGGPGWVSRALYSAADIQKTLKDTSYLIGAQRFTAKTQCRSTNTKCKEMVAFLNSENQPSWERLRFYYFLEKLSPGNEKRGSKNKKSGREMSFTSLNLAHTEAVLGREVKNRVASYGMVEVWAQYLKKEKLHCSK